MRNLDLNTVKKVSYRVIVVVFLIFICRYMFLTQQIFLCRYIPTPNIIQRFTLYRTEVVSAARLNKGFNQIFFGPVCNSFLNERSRLKIICISSVFSRYIFNDKKKDTGEEVSQRQLLKIFT